MVINGLQHVGLPSMCYEETLSFYKKLGFESILVTQGKRGNPISFLKIGNLILEVVEKTMEKRTTGSLDHIALDVADIEASYKEISQLGFVSLEGSIQFLDFWTNGVRYFTILGPNGEKVEFSQYL